MSSEVKTWIEDYNKSVDANEQIIVEYVDPCLTSVYQPPDLVMNAPLKRMIRHQYHNYIHDLLQNPQSRCPALNVGDHVAVSREKLVVQ